MSNPFVDDFHLTIFNSFIMILCFPIFFIRFVFFSITLITLLFHYSLFNINNDMIKKYSRLLIYIVGFQVNIHNFEPNNLSQIIISNHSLLFDSFLLSAYISNSCYIASSWIKNIPIISKIHLLSGGFYVDRKRKNNLTQIIKNKLDSVEYSNKHLIIYAEGTITNNNSLINFRSSAFTFKKPISPVFIKYNYNNFGISNNIFLCLYRIFILPNKKVDIYFNNLYNPTFEELNNAEYYKNNFRILYAKNNNLSLFDNNFNDAKIY